MAVQIRYPVVNPKLRTLFAILVSVFVSTILLLLILEFLGTRKIWLSQIMVGVPLGAALLIGLAAFNNSLHDFFIAGRRVPADFNGFALVLTSIGGVGLSSIVGFFYFIGFDALCFVLGWCFGFLLVAIFFAPYLRKAGAFTVSGFCALRFGSPTVGLVAVILVLPPMLLLLAAELETAILAAASIWGLSKQSLAIFVTIGVVLLVLLGGMRSLTWSQCALFFIVLIGLLVPLFVLSIWMTNLPIPQLTYGMLLDDLALLETNNGLKERVPQFASESLPGVSLTSIDKTYLQPFGAIGGVEFFFLLLCFMVGTASLPGVLVRASTVPRVSDARRAYGWALLLLALIMISVPAYAVFAKYLTLKNLAGSTIDQIPAWFQTLSKLGVVAVEDTNQDARLGLSEIRVTRDGVLPMLPIMAEMPYVLIVLSGSVVFAAAFGAAAAHLVVVSNMIANDLLSRPLAGLQVTRFPIHVARVTMILIAAFALWLAFTIGGDPFWMFAWALSLLGSTLFAPMVFAVLARDIGSPAIVAAMVSGFLTALAVIWVCLGGGRPIFGVDHLTAGVIGVPVSFASGLVVNAVTPERRQDIRDLVSAMRNSNGETIFDRVLGATIRRKLRS